MIRIVAVGKCKEAYWRDAIAEYRKRLGAYTRLELTEVADEPAPERLTARERAQVMEREGERILRSVPPDSCCIALAVDGKRFSSETLAAFLKQRMDHGAFDLTFVIGGSLGLAPCVLQRADLRLSFSDFTFPHQLMRVILLEQIYRSFRIIRNEPYHK